MSLMNFSMTVGLIRPRERVGDFNFSFVRKEHILWTHISDFIAAISS